jgi:hypothetical protein
LEDYESRGSHLVDHRFNNNRRHPNALHIERVGSTRREIEDASASVWTRSLILTTTEWPLPRFVTFA